MTHINLKIICLLFKSHFIKLYRSLNYGGSNPKTALQVINYNVEKKGHLN